MVLALLFAMQAAAPIGTSPAVARGEKLFAQGCASAIVTALPALLPAARASVAAHFLATTCSK